MPRVPGRRVVLVTVAIALVVTVGFIAAVLLNYPAIRDALNRHAR
jgi:hypothetical protein